MTPSIQSRISPRLWLFIGGLFLSISWLLPNHQYPWTSFHSDAWAALVLAIGGGAYLIATTCPRVHWSPLALLVTILIPVPVLQYATGLLPFAGDLWMGTIFLLGLTLALLAGGLWQRINPNQLGDLIFLAVGVAAMISVGLQLYQWFGFTLENAVTNIWVYPLFGDRPYANLGQPNQLSTLLLWGLLAGIWGKTRGFIRLPTLCIYCAILVLGLVLTQSRTALLAITLIVLAAWFWRKRWPSKEIPWVISAIALLFVVLTLSIGTLAKFLLLDLEPNIADRLGGDAVRPAVWRMFVEASLEQPWFGYGWNQVRSAQLAVTLAHPATHGISYAQSHNLFIDIALWFGIPAGIFLAVAVMTWLWRRFRSVKQAEDAILWLAVGTVGLHSMVEYPLHYAYFLLPAGLFMGMLEASTRARSIFTTSRGALIGLWVLAGAGLGVVINDYFHAEKNLVAVRFEQLRIGNSPVPIGSDLVLLTQLRENLRLARLEEGRSLSTDELAWMRTVTTHYPSLSNLIKLAVSLGLSGNHAEARLWLRRTCAVVPAGQCEMAERAWEEKRRSYPALASIEWPVYDK